MTEFSIPQRASSPFPPRAIPPFPPRTNSPFSSAYPVYRPKPRGRPFGISLLTVVVISAFCSAATAFAVISTNSMIGSSDNEGVQQVAAMAKAAVDKIMQPTEVVEVAEAGTTPIRSETVLPGVSSERTAATAMDETELSSTAATKAPTPLHGDDPRWASNREVANVKPDDIEWEGDVPVADTEAEVAALEKTLDSDITTGGISSVKPLVPALSDELLKKNPVELALVEPKEPARKRSPERISEVPSFTNLSMVNGTTTDHVNMRVARKNGSTIITVVPNNSSIAVEANCRHWCATVFDGQRGYIYRRYFKYETEQSSDADADAASDWQRTDDGRVLRQSGKTEAEHSAFDAAEAPNSPDVKWQVGR